MSTSYYNVGYTGYTGDKSDNFLEGKEEDSNNSGKSGNINNTYINCPKPSDSRIKHTHPFYYCKEHPEFENIHLEVLESHLILAKDHKSWI